MRSRRDPRHHVRHTWPLVVAGLLSVTAVAVLVGCARNDPFDPDTVANQPPVVRLFVTPVDPGTQLNPTSYYNRRFRWSGTDPDGWVAEYYVSIRTDTNVPTPWATTTRTDTFMTFTTDANGEAEATVLLVCRDNRGALSDTVVQFIPLRNFPPVIGFATDYDPLKNMQREVVAVGDTNYWNWGPMSFRLFALDPDSAATMDDFFRYTLADGDPAETYDQGDPLADPLLNWVRVPFDPFEQIKNFSIRVSEAPPSQERTLTVSVKDEADADTRFTYSWEVRAPSGPVLYIPDNSSPTTKTLYRDFLDGYLGAGNFDEYDFWFGFPDDAFVLLESLRKFELILWTDGGAATTNIQNASSNGGVLEQLIQPTDATPARRLLIVSRVMTGESRKLSNNFLLNLMGVSPTASPPTPLSLPVGKSALGLQGHLPNMITTRAVTMGGTGLAVQTSGVGEAIYQMEECTGCYGNRPPFDPVVGVRSPVRAQQTLAAVVGIGLQLDNFDQVEVYAALAAILEIELGVVAP